MKKNIKIVLLVTFGFIATFFGFNEIKALQNCADNVSTKTLKFKCQYKISFEETSTSQIVAYELGIYSDNLRFSASGNIVNGLNISHFTGSDGYTCPSANDLAVTKSGNNYKLIFYDGLDISDSGNISSCSEDGMWFDCVYNVNALFPGGNIRITGWNDGRSQPSGYSLYSTNSGICSTYLKINQVMAFKANTPGYYGLVWGSTMSNCYISYGMTNQNDFVCPSSLTVIKPDWTSLAGTDYYFANTCTVSNENRCLQVPLINSSSCVDIDGDSTIDFLSNNSCVSSSEEEMESFECETGYKNDAGYQINIKGIRPKVNWQDLVLSDIIYSFEGFDPDNNVLPVSNFTSGFSNVVLQTGCPKNLCFEYMGGVLKITGDQNTCPEMGSGDPGLDPGNIDLTPSDDINASFTGSKKCIEALGQNTVDFLKKLYKALEIISPIVVIALSMVDFTRGIADGTRDQDLVKKAVKKLISRGVVLIFLYLLPGLIKLIGSIMNLDVSCLI